jgi:hypothetical protein
LSACKIDLLLLVLDLIVIRSPLLQFLFFFTACQRHSDQDLRVLDLSTYGVPLTILAPEGAEINRKNYDIILDLTIRKGDHYFIQVFKSETTATDPDELKSRQLNSVKQEKNFGEIVRDEKDGFIYHRKPANSPVNYDFRFVKIKDGMEIIFQAGQVGEFTLEDVEMMYKSVSSQ